MIAYEFNDNGLTVRLKGLARALDDLTPIWPQVHDVYTDFVEKNFDTMGAYTGQTWVPLSPSYAAWKAKNAAGKGMLHLTERLYPSLVQEGGEHVHLTGPDFAEFGTRVPYARAHQKGRPEVGLPARVVIPKPTNVEAGRVVDIILAFLFRTLRLGRAK